MYNKSHIKSEDFTGTYEVENTMFRYLTIYTNVEDTYLIYDSENEIRIEGKCEKTNNNYATLYGKENEIIATIIYINENYYIIEN